MPAESLADRESTVRPAIDLSIGGRLTMVAIGYIPLLHLGCCLALALLLARYQGYTWSAAATAAAIYLVPPLATRIVRLRATEPEARHAVGSAMFLKWWYTSQWQVLFQRLPILEELLRLAPGLYSAWLRLWGAKVGRLVYWSPGLILFDRGFLDIGDHVVIGANSKICPHLLSRSPEGEMQLLLAPVVIGHDTMIGGSTLLPAGVQVGPCEQTPGFKPLAPFAQFRDGQHIRTTRFNGEAQNE